MARVLQMSTVSLIEDYVPSGKLTFAFKESATVTIVQIHGQCSCASAFHVVVKSQTALVADGEARRTDVGQITLGFFGNFSVDVIACQPIKKQILKGNIFLLSFSTVLCTTEIQHAWTESRAPGWKGKER